MSYTTITPDSLDSVNKMIISERYNGRVNIAEPPSPEKRFQMAEKIAIKNKAVEFREAINGTWEDNVLSQVFFSEGNMQILQNGIRAGVYKMSHSRFVIPPQNVDSLKIVMRSIYLQYAKHYPNNITEQVDDLNKLVLDYAIPSTYNEAMAYLKYVQDQSTIAVPLELPQQHDRVYKQLELKPWF